MTIVDPKFGGEIMTKKGKAYKFDDAACMIHFLSSGTLKEDDISQKLFVNFQKRNDFIDANNAFFLMSPELKSPMGGNVAAFASQQEAEKIKLAEPASTLKWKDVLSKLE
jgi:copper chaperone NosL